MPVEEVLARIGIADIIEQDVLLVQFGVLGATVLFLALALLVLVFAFRATGRARAALIETRSHLRSVQDLAVEVRQLSAQTERTAAKRYAMATDREEEMSAPVRVGARETTPEADVIVLDTEDQADDGASDRNLAAARESASVPSGLLRGLMRRR